MLAKLLFVGAISLSEYEAHVHRGNYIERNNREFYREAAKRKSEHKEIEKPKSNHKSLLSPAWGVVNLTDGDDSVQDDPKFDFGKAILEFFGLDLFVASNQNTEEVTSPFTDSEIKDDTKSWKVDDAGVPTAMFHGFGDACANSGMKQIDKTFAEGTGAPVHCIEVGTSGEVTGNFESIAKNSCEQVAANPDFQGEFNVVGLSQGGLLARYIVEECDMKGKVRNMLTIGGPHMGVDAIPHCLSGVFCSLVNAVAKKFVYYSFAQNWIGPAGYFRDVNDFTKYQWNSVFLPALNNEEAHNGDTAAVRKERFSNLNAAMLIMFQKDTMIYPKETAWFQELDTHGKVQQLNNTDFYKNDNIGLRHLTEAGKVEYLAFEGDHLQFSLEDVKKTMIPFLKK